MKNQEKIVILDFGGQYSQLIARRVREAKVYCEVQPYNKPVETFKENCCGIILTGGPRSVYGQDALKLAPEVLALGVPVLGICYGAQLLAATFGGAVAASLTPEYGHAKMSLSATHPLLETMPEKQTVWMNHNDIITRLPEGFVLFGGTSSCPVAAFGSDDKKIYGLQYHPEVVHTPEGKKLFNNFLYNICHCKGDWTMDALADTLIADIKAQVGDGLVLSGLSGGVDSSVASVLVHKAVGDKLTCVFVNHGLLRKNEAEEVMSVYGEKLGLNIVYVEASQRFLSKLKDVTDPEQKRKVIGSEFIRVFEEEAQKLGDVDFLVQGTIYPDVIESGVGDAAVIKSHHNVGGLPKNIKFKELVEPLRYLFKDEVRALGEQLGIPANLVWRQPFPGPGLAVRCLGEVAEAKLAILRETDAVLREEIANAGLEREIWQYFTVFTGLKTTGVMGDARTYDYTIAIRAITSVDAMTVEIAELPYPLLKKISGRIINEVDQVNRVVYDITSKPPGTIEWE